MRKGMDSDYMGMIHEDHSETANLPQGVVMKPYPRNKFMSGYELDDTIRGIDDTDKDNERKVEKHQSDSMY